MRSQPLPLSGCSCPCVPGSAQAVAVAPDADDPQVRLVVRTDTRAAGREVAEALSREGARPAGRVPRLKAVAVDVAASEAVGLRSLLLRRADVTSVEVANRRWFSEEPADPRFPEQKPYLDAIRATGAWGRPAHGSPDVRIAVIDSGVDVTHPDLAGKIAGSFNAVQPGSSVRDVVGHGTGVASVAAAATGNGVGISGAGYNSSLLAVKVADRTGRIFTDDLAAGIVWAVDSGADVINLSLGGPTSDDLERDAISYAQKRGVLIVAAAGNAGSTAKQFPAAHPGVLSVGATSANGSSRAAFSSFGSWVDVAAPGKGIVVAAPGGGYEKADGTSFASPLVAGQVALLEAFRPGRTAAELSAAVTSGANTAKLGFARGLVDVEASLDLLPPGTVPTILSPAEGSPTSGTTTVNVSSSAPRVRLTFADLTKVVSTGGGFASGTFETYGLVGPQPVTAADCSRLDQCSATPATVTATVVNPAPTLTAPAGGSAQSDDVIRAAADAPAEAAVRFQVDNTDAVLSAAGQTSHEALLSTERLTDGVHTVSAVLCRRDGSVCDDGTASSATVSVDRLHPSVTGVSVQYLSPNGDGRNDTATVRYRLESRQVVTLRVRNDARTVVYSKRLGEQATGPHSAVWNGRTDAGPVVGNGVWTLEIATSSPDGSQAGLASRPVTVDRARPKVTDVASGVRALYPVRDGYRDRTDVTATLGEDARRIGLQVRDSAGRVVRTKQLGGQRAGDVNATWNGRGRGGDLLPAGRYTVRLVVEDRAGNRTNSEVVRQTVSAQRTVRRSGTMTVTARESLTESFADDCSSVFRHTKGKRQGWIGYYSSGTCASGDAYAVADHQVRLPAAVRYGSVRLSARGGRADPRFRDSAQVAYYDRFQNASEADFRLSPALGTYTGPRVKADRHLIRNRIFRWSTFTTGVAWYDVDTYTVRFTYDVLR